MYNILHPSVYTFYGRPLRISHNYFSRKNDEAILNKRVESPRTTLNNLINLSNKENSTKKEVIVIDKKPLVETSVPFKPDPPTPTTKQNNNNFNSNSSNTKVVTFADTIEVEKPPSPSKIILDEGIAEDQENTMVENNKSTNYRDNWKKRDAENNTMVFNFLNTQKDVTHIENDGLDLSHRKKKHHLNRLAKVGLLQIK